MYRNRRIIKSSKSTHQNIQNQSNDEGDLDDDKQNQAKLILLQMDNEDQKSNYHYSNFYAYQNLDQQFREQNLTKQIIRGSIWQDEQNQFKSKLIKNKMRPSKTVFSSFENKGHFEMKYILSENPFKNINLSNINEKIKNHRNLLNKLTSKKQQKTILNLKRLLKKLQSPQNKKNKKNNFIQQKIINNDSNSIKQYFTGMKLNQIQVNNKEFNEVSLNEKFSISKIQVLEKLSRNGVNTSNKKKRGLSQQSDFTHSNHNQTEIFMFQSTQPLKSTKLRNSTNFMMRYQCNKRSDLKKKTQPLKREFNSTASSARNSFNKRFKDTKQQFDQIFINQQKLRNGRQSRNLKNILFN